MNTNQPDTIIGMIKHLTRNDTGFINKLYDRIEKGGEEINTPDAKGQTPLMWAARDSIARIIMKDLISAGAQINAQDKAGKTALMHAAYNGETDAVKILIAQNSETTTLKDVKDKKISSRPVGQGEEVVQREDFEKWHLFFTIRDHAGKTALDYARERGHAEIIKLLEEK